MILIKKSKVLSSQDSRDILQDVTDKDRKALYKIYGVVPKNQDNYSKGYRGAEKDEWERRKWGIKHKEL